MNTGFLLPVSDWKARIRVTLGATGRFRVLMFKKKKNGDILLKS